MSLSTATVVTLRSVRRAAPAPPQPRGIRYSRPLRQVRDAGPLERRWKIMATAVLLAVGWVAFVLIGGSWWRLATGAFLAFVLTDRHNSHHVHPKQWGKDPDVEMGAPAFTIRQAAHQHGAGGGGPGREDGLSIDVPPGGAWGPLHLVASFPAPGTARIAVAGEIDLANSGLVRDALLALVRDQALTVVDADLSGLRFLDCAGIGALVAVYAAAARSGGRLVISDPQPLVRKVLELTGVLELLTRPPGRPPAAPGAVGEQGRPSDARQPGAA